MSMSSCIFIESVMQYFLSPLDKIDFVLGEQKIITGFVFIDNTELNEWPRE